MFSPVGVREGVNETKRTRRTKENGRRASSGSLASPGRGARAFCSDEKARKGGGNGGEGKEGGRMSLPMNIDATCVLWSRGRSVARRVAIMRSYNIATPRNDIKLLATMDAWPAALTAVKSGSSGTLRFAMKILLNAQAHAARRIAVQKDVFRNPETTLRLMCHLRIIIVTLTEFTIGKKLLLFPTNYWFRWELPNCVSLKFFFFLLHFPFHIDLYANERWEMWLDVTSTFYYREKKKQLL